MAIRRKIGNVIFFGQEKGKMPNILPIAADKPLHFTAVDLRAMLQVVLSHCLTSTKQTFQIRKSSICLGKIKNSPCIRLFSHVHF
jgi:hypothetical protein